MEFRRIFDTIPEAFDRWRPRYTPAACEAIIASASLSPGKAMLELGPGTGQATEPFLRTGCDYLGIELGEHLAAVAREKFRRYPNFQLICGDFLTQDFGAARFDLILSAATIQWLPEEPAYRKCLALLNPGGALAMMRLQGDYRTPNPALYEAIQQVYAVHFHPKTPYTRRFGYQNAPAYGFAGTETLTFPATRVYSADDYVAYLHTHCDHLTLRDPDRTAFFSGIRDAIQRHGGKIVFLDNIVVDLARK